jgi:hypothetical protein
MYRRGIAHALPETHRPKDVCATKSGQMANTAVATDFPS